MNMTDASETIQLIAIGGAAFISLFCCLIMLISCFEASKGTHMRKIAVIATVMFFCASLSWFSALIYLLHPKVFVVMHPAMYLAMLYYEVLLYYLTFRITRTEEGGRFNVWHFMTPLLLVGAIFSGAFFVPSDVQLTITESRGKIYGDYKLYAFLMTSKSFTFFIYNIVYSLLSLYRIRQYQKVISDYSADEGRSPVRWLYLLFFISLASLPIVLLGSFLGKNPLFNTVALVFPLLMTVVQDIMVCYNVAVVNFKIIETEAEPATTAKPRRHKVNKKLDKERFERYIRQHKPFLNPDLHITDMTAELLTNRTYLSAFINKEYGMNFSSYINYCRLKELDKLRNTSDYAGCGGSELVQKAGFSNYKGYMRAKSEEDKRATVKME